MTQIQIIEKINELKRQNHKNPSTILKESINRLYRELDKLERQEEMEKYNWKTVKKVLRKLGVKKTKSSSTAIRGYNTYTQGWDANFNVFPERVEFIEIEHKRFNEILEAFKEANIDVVEIHRPTKSIGCGYTSWIVLGEK